MTDDACFQMILLATDSEIIKSLEELIDSGDIRIPATEIREPIYLAERGGWQSVRIECSRFGVRFKTERQNTSLAKVKRLVREVYPGQELAQLEWKLRHEKGESLFEKLDHYVDRENPVHILENLVLASEAHILRAFKNLQFGNFTLPQSPEEESKLVRKMLWKLNFDIGL